MGAAVLRLEHMDEATIARFHAKVATGDPSQCWEWRAGRFRDGYGMFALGRVDGKFRVVRAHRVAFLLHQGAIPNGDGLVVMHACDNPPCCNPAHLSIGTLADNRLDASRKGRLPVTRRRKLSDEDVRCIRASVEAGESQQDTARRFGVSKTTVSMIVSGKAKGSVR